MNDVRKELTHLNVHDLQEKLDGLRKELFGLRINASTAHIKDYSQFKKLRRNIARVQTFLHYKKSQ